MKIFEGIAGYAKQVQQMENTASEKNRECLVVYRILFKKQQPESNKHGFKNHPKLPKLYWHLSKKSNGMTCFLAA